MPSPVQRPLARWKLLSLVIPILLLLSVSSSLFYFIRTIEFHPADGSEGYRIWLRPTRDRYLGSITTNLRERIRSLAINGTTVRIQPGEPGKGIGNILQDNAGNMITTEFTLTEPGERFCIGEYHGGTVFTVKQITPEAIVFSYLHTVSGYNGYGGQLARQDTGEITLAPFCR
jgi:hypothetical protein